MISFLWASLRQRGRNKAILVKRFSLAQVTAQSSALKWNKKHQAFSIRLSARPVWAISHPLLLLRKANKAPCYY